MKLSKIHKRYSTKKKKKKVALCKPERKASPMMPLFWTSSLQNFKRINFCPFCELLSLCYFLIEARSNQLKSKDRANSPGKISISLQNNEETFNIYKQISEVLWIKCFLTTLTFHIFTPWQEICTMILLCPFHHCKLTYKKTWAWFLSYLGTNLETHYVYRPGLQIYPHLTQMLGFWSWS